MNLVTHGQWLGSNLLKLVELKISCNAQYYWQYFHLIICCCLFARQDYRTYKCENILHRHLLHWISEILFLAKLVLIKCTSVCMLTRWMFTSLQMTNVTILTLIYVHTASSTRNARGSGSITCLIGHFEKHEYQSLFQFIEFYLSTSCLKCSSFLSLSVWKWKAFRFESFLRAMADVCLLCLKTPQTVHCVGRKYC